MAGPVGHLFIADKLNLVGANEKADFFIGTLFPDIRMLGVIERERTHFENVEFDQVLSATTAFESGFLLHSWLDTTREQFVREKGVYDKLPEGYLSTVALKICEDVRLYEQYPSWSMVSECLNSVIDEERTFDIEENDLVHWHRMHQEFISVSPLLTYPKFFASANYGTAQIHELGGLIELIQSTRVLNTYFDDLLNYLTVNKIHQEKKLEA